MFFQSNKPPVVLFAWAFSSDDHMKKYAEMHNKFGHDTIRFYCEPEYLFGNDVPKQRNIAESNLDEIKKEFHTKGEKLRLITHAFSNNGYNHFAHVEHLIRSDPDIEVCGAIFDSCPRPFTILHWMIVPPSGRWGTKVKANMNMPAIAYWLILYTTQGYSMNDSIKEALKVWRSCRNNWDKHLNLYPDAALVKNGNFELPGNYPLLYLYSTRDIMMTFNVIASFANYFRRKGNRKAVISHNFHTSPHCMHYYTYPDKYETLVKQLLKNI